LTPNTHADTPLSLKRYALIITSPTQCPNMLCRRLPKNRCRRCCCLNTSVGIEDSGPPTTSFDSA
jgi:hypothetical protein